MLGPKCKELRMDAIIPTVRSTFRGNNRFANSHMYTCYNTTVFFNMYVCPIIHTCVCCSTERYGRGGKFVELLFIVRDFELFPPWRDPYTDTKPLGPWGAKSIYEQVKGCLDRYPLDLFVEH